MTFETASRVLADHKDNAAEELRKLRISKSSSRRPEKASKTQTVILGHSSDEVDDSSDESSPYVRGSLGRLSQLLKPLTHTIGRLTQHAPNL